MVNKTWCEETAEWQSQSGSTTYLKGNAGGVRIFIIGMKFKASGFRKPAVTGAMTSDPLWLTLNSF
jgi:hypothetical protein